MGESLWIIVGFLGVAIGLLLGRHPGTAPETRREAGKCATIDDLDRLSLKVDDALDKIEHLYDRIRKRYRVEDAPQRAPEPALDGKDALRALARAKGLWPLHRLR